MEIKWKKILSFGWFRRFYVIFVFGFVANLKFSSSYVYESLREKKLEDNETVLPVWFYSTAAQALPVLVFSDFLRFDPVIFVIPITGIISSCFWIWGNSLTTIKIAQVFSGSVTAAEVAYFASIFSYGQSNNYQILSAIVRAAPLLGKTISYLFSQVIISHDALRYSDLYYFDLGVLILALGICCFFPRREKKAPRSFPIIVGSSPDKYVVKWTFWSILTICMYHQVTINAQELWAENGIGKYSGLIEGLNSLFSLSAVIFGGFAIFDWKFNGDLILSMTSLLQAFMVLFMSRFSNNVLNAFLYFVHGFIFQFITTILASELAKKVPQQNFGFIFGLIFCIGTALSSVMVLFLNDPTGQAWIGYQLEIADIFLGYGYCYLVISVSFIIVGLSYWFAKHTYA